MSEIQKFFEGDNIFITGGTGFIGKILLEKLVRSLPKVGNIYLLMRPRKGKEIQERLNEIFNLEIFDRLGQKDPFFKRKIIPISGDITKPGLGLSEEDRQIFINEVSVVIHSAATTRFNEPLRVAVAVNVNSVLEIIALCRELKKLKAAVYVSTAFSQSNIKFIEEKVYPVPLTYEEVNKTVEIIERRNLSKEDEEKFTKILLGDYPNTYIFTKSIAEGILNENARDLPFCIFRFPVALATYREPVVGWLDTVQGFNQGIIALGTGVIHVVICPDDRDLLYLVPADFVCNALIASTWETGSTKNRSLEASLPVYNYVNGNKNPLTKNYFEKIARSNYYYVPTKVVYLPEAIVARSKRSFAFFNFFLHLLPALIGDIFLRILGRKPILHKMYKQGLKLLESAEFFLITSWSIDNKNSEALWEKLSEEDKKIFRFDMTTVDWPDVLLELWKGIMKYILKDDLSPEGRRKALRKYYKLLVIHRTLQFLFVTFMIWLIWTTFSSIF